LWNQSLHNSLQVKDRRFSGEAWSANPMAAFNAATYLLNARTLMGLADAVESGTLPESVFHGSSAIRGHWAYITGLDNGQRRMVLLAYNGSLDAAMALHDAVLPGWVVQNIGQDGFDPGDGWTAWIVHPEYLDNFMSQGGKAKDPACAWLLAIIRALSAQAEKGV
jgi:hypothetical protein